MLDHWTPRFVMTEQLHALEWAPLTLGSSVVRSARLEVLVARVGVVLSSLGSGLCRCGRTLLDAAHKPPRRRRRTLK